MVPFDTGISKKAYFLFFADGYSGGPDFWVVSRHRKG